MDIETAARIIRDGGIVAFPTETVYGLGADAFSPKAVFRIYEEKGRPEDNPCIVHIADSRMLRDVAADVPETAKRLMDAFWPGPLTVILPKSRKVPDIVTADLPTVGVRMPDNDIARELIRRAGRPIAAPSANLAGRPSPTTAYHVEQDFPDVPVLDGGKTVLGLESTVVALDPPRVLRQGAVTLEQLREVVPGFEVAEQDPDRPEAPGMKHKHYAPERPLILFQELDHLKTYVKDHDVVVLCTEQHVREFENAVSLGKTPEEVAQNLYDALRTDRPGREICILAIDRKGIGSTIMDRLERAATRTV